MDKALWHKLIKDSSIRKICAYYLLLSVLLPNNESMNLQEYKMERTFATHNHTSSVRSVASDKHYLASGGADDSVYLYDMRYRIESGRLMHHNDTVNCVAFTPEASHLFTCSNDGTIAAIKCGNWQMEKHWQKAHKGLGVNTLAIHPTGKIALSTGADGILRTWNLIKGRQAYATNLVPRLKLDAKNVNILKWSPNGEKYLLAVNQRIDVYSVELAGIGSEIKFNAKIVCVEFLRDDLIAVGLENGQIKFYDLEKSVQTLEAIAHDTRVKCMAFKDDLLVTASSSGEIKLWRYGKHKLRMLQNVNCGARITCLSLAMPYKSLYDDATIKAEEEVEVPRKNRFKIGQEVIVEKEENDWEISSISKKKKSKKKRSIEEGQDSNAPDKKKNKSLLKKKKSEDLDTIISDDAPKKRNRLSENENGNVTWNKNKRRKKRSIPVEENNNIPAKKLKSAKKSILESKEIDNQDVLRLKRKKDTNAEESGTILKKKKKKQ
nr:PREDICTED: p21-activated protein kinase-interacting protein 1-like isoform X2 [Megachile rotundata]XP_012153595.1 PREDICTED: p21-activated protein kinase-interacting protein 1-like isoform X2 [Megachile rotundata]XP_012153596.1 PREDICTED: p21-activated protein kinase-interacting protein 1-like isoform X2 [Megachile rotundata]